MACTFESEDEKKSFVRRCVSGGIKDVDGGQRNVAQITILGNGGLGHTSAFRKRYRAAINARLLKRGPDCGMKSLTPESFTAPGLVIVRDVSDLVLGDL